MHDALSPNTGLLSLFPNHDIQQVIVPGERPTHHNNSNRTLCQGQANNFVFDPVYPVFHRLYLM